MNSVENNREKYPVIFMDIDGVLNNHDWNDDSQSCGIVSDCVMEFNRILKQTQAKIVLSSAWRYMVHGHAMTLKGFEYLLRTHKVAVTEIVGLTMKDEETPGYEHKNTNIQFWQNKEIFVRGEQISHWLGEHPEVTDYVILDDMATGFDSFGERFIKTNPNKGLTRTEANKAIDVLLCKDVKENDR